MTENQDPKDSLPDHTPNHPGDSSVQDGADNHDAAATDAVAADSGAGDGGDSPKRKKHLVRPTWLRRTLKTLLVVIVVILLLPVLLYIPPVQDFAVKFASDYVAKSTGMKIGIGKFRLKFPLDVSLRDVYVVQASGDTMVRAREAIADVKLLPLLRMDVEIKRLQLNDGYYRMVSPDSSMILTVNAGFLEVDDKSSANIKNSEILLNKTRLRDGKLTLYMDVWKKEQTPADTTSSSTPFLIKANDLEMDNFSFGMSMLPTIDTMDVAVKRVAIKQAVVDLRENLVKWKLASLSGGDFTYLTPTTEYIKTHPAPPSQPSTGPPMRIMGDSIAVDSLSALYAVRDAKPLPGFDASYLKVTGVGIGMRGFYNESSTVRLPLTRLTARERCGLQITQGSGTVGIDSIGLKLDKVAIRTLFSNINATADVPFAMMALDPQSDMSVNANGRIGLPDVEAFMPSLKAMLANVPARKPLDFKLDASGSLADLAIRNLTADMPGVVSIAAKGYAKNPLDYKKMTAKVDFDGTLSDPAVADKFLAMQDMKIPAFTIKGTAEAQGLSYGADFTLRSDAGDVAAKGHVALTPENYTADIDAVGIDVARFVPSAGIGRVTATVNARGHGFNPLSGTAVTDAVVNIASIEYNKRDLRDIHLAATLTNAGDLTLQASSPNPGLDFDLNGSGSIHPDNYVFDIAATLRDVNLQQLGLSDSICYGSGDIALRGSAQPGKWIYDVDLDAQALEWHLPGQYIHLPEGVTANVRTDAISTSLKVNSLLTTLDFNSQTGLENVIKSFTAAADMVSRQIAAKSVAVDSLSAVLPPFTLDVNASGRGLIDQFLQSSGMGIDTVAIRLAKDSIITGNIEALNYTSPSMNLDTLTLALSERGQLMDYKAHLGNRRGTLDEFARVNLNGYFGANRLSAFLNQWNIKGEQGYRIGLTAAVQDSIVTAHVTPLKSTIAYMPWTFNSDNFIDFNIKNKHIGANLQAQSAESSILAKTQESPFGDEEFYVKIDNLHVQDFLSMWALAPPIKGDLNADLHVRYDNRRFMGAGSVGFKNFIYEKTTVGDFDLDLRAAYGLDSSTDVNAALKVNGEPAISAYAKLIPENETLKAESVGVSLTRFPLKVANPFLGNALVLNGYLNGDMKMDGSFAAPVLNGAIAFDSVTANIPMFDALLRFGEDRLTVKDNVVAIDNFDIFAANDNPLELNGTVDAKKFSNILVDLTADANNLQLIKSDKRSKGDLFGKIFLNIGATVKGPLSLLDINGNVNLLGTTDATYRLNMAPAELTSQTDQDVVRFVNFNDTTQVEKADSIEQSALNMRINANLVISSGTHLEVLLSSNGTDKVELDPTANLNFFQNYMGDMSLTGTLTLGNGYARYAVPVIGEKMFEFDPASTLTWTGAIMNPTLNVKATDEIKANVKDGNNSRLVNFLVTLNATNTLENLKVAFDLATNDDLTIQNELRSMTADQRQTQAMNLLLYNQYSSQGTKASVASGNMLYSFLESKLNSWAAKNIRGVDLSFGVNQYDKTTNGVTNTETSYSYQVSKSLFNNRFKILVGGNYSTDSADDEIAQNLVSDVAFEYILKQTQTINMSVRLFRHIGYESILEGEITEMGAGFVFKRRLENLKSLFRFRRRKKDTPAPADPTLNLTPDSAVINKETVTAAGDTATAIKKED